MDGVMLVAWEEKGWLSCYKERDATLFLLLIESKIDVSG